MAEKESRPRPTPEDSEIDKELAHEVIQHGVDQSIAKRTQVERAIQQHPQREVPRVESVEPPEIP